MVLQLIVPAALRDLSGNDVHVIVPHRDLRPLRVVRIGSLRRALGAVPADALRGAVRKLAGQSADDTEAEILARAETAATVDLATERDEADDEDEMEDDEY